MKYIIEDLDYIFIRSQLPSGKWDNLSLNEISDKQFVDWANTKFYLEIKDDPTAKGTAWSKQQKVDFLNEMMARNNGKPVVVMIKREARKDFETRFEKEISNCHDCGAKPGEVHKDGCDTERCSVCGGQRLGDICKGHDKKFARWTGFWPGAIEAEYFGVDLNEFEQKGYYKLFFIKPK